ncbi:hypothetical protein D7X33_19755 [Butyricicoccus sp. 1XD8-22]|nr:hypothetical protein D7X33_19755 [Butyricicoccus sp. 1XD8-22]
MTLLAKKITVFFKNHNAITDLQYELFQFAVEGVIYDILIFALCIRIGIRFTLPFENCVFLCSYVALRHYAGGIHAKTRNHCLICSCSICYMCMMIIKYFPPKLTVFFYIFALCILSKKAPYMTFTNPKTIQQKSTINLYFRKLICLLSVVGISGMALQLSAVYVPIFTAFGVVSMLILISTNNGKPKQAFITKSLRYISAIVLSIGVTMVQTPCPHWLYESDISESLRRYTDNL